MLPLRKREASAVEPVAGFTEVRRRLPPRWTLCVFVGGRYSNPKTSSGARCGKSVQMLRARWCGHITQFCALKNQLWTTFAATLAGRWSILRWPRVWTQCAPRTYVLYYRLQYCSSFYSVVSLLCKITTCTRCNRTWISPPSEETVGISSHLSALLRL